MKIKILILISLFLNGCEMYTAHVNPYETKPYLNKKLRMTQSMVLVQTRDPRPWGENYYYLIPTQATTSIWSGKYLSVMNQKIPSEHDFQKSKMEWQSWKGAALFNQSRIVDIIKAGTEFHISRIITAPYAAFEVELTLDSGTYSGVKALSVEPEKLVPKNILREENQKIN